jgi:hypothetical protein
MEILLVGAEMFMRTGRHDDASSHFSVLRTRLKIVREYCVLVCSIRCRIPYISVSQTVVRGPQVVLGFCICGPLRLNISPKKTEKIKLT